MLFLVLSSCRKRTMVSSTGRKEKKYMYICIYDKWNYHFEKSMPTPFLYCYSYYYYYYYYYYICLFGWLRHKGEVGRSNISDYIYIYIYMCVCVYQLTNIIILLALYAYRYGVTIDLIPRNY